MQTEILKMSMKAAYRTLVSAGHEVLAGITAIILAGITYGCASIDNDPYSATMNTLSINVIYPEGKEQYMREGVSIAIEDINRGNAYKTATDKDGKASMRLPNGIYRVTVSDRTEESVFNGSSDKVNLSEKDVNLSLNLIESKSGDIIIKEI